ncbi:MAG TPA: HEAT repeat domain-containing protein [Gemmatimonadales bacterium]|nr:HEAT repeat domain-containing protein [Gemmatimonadales bacterium]
MTESAVAFTGWDPQLVDQLMQTLVKGLRATQIYLPNNPVYQQAMENVRAAFRAVWEGCDELTLAVTESDFVFEKRVVLSQPNRSESIPWVLFKDGVRSLTLKKGVEQDELPRLLSVIHKAKQLPPEANDDLLTLLWEQDFQFIRYHFVELATAEAAPLVPTGEPPPAPPEDRRRQVEEEAAQPEPPKGIVSLEDFDSTLYFLDDGERNYLQSEVEREYGQDLRSNVLAMLMDLLELQTYPTVRAELISIIQNFIPYLLAVGDFRSVAYVCRELRVVLQRARELLPEHRTELEQLPAKLSEPEALSQLLQSLDEASVHPTEEDLGELFRELRPAALGTVLHWLPKLSNQRVRELLYGAGQRLAQAYPGEVSKALETKDERVLLEIVKMVTRLKLPPVAPALGALFATASKPVKVAAVEALAAIASPGAMQQLERAVDDADRDVRIAAVKVLSARNHRAVLPKVEAAVDGKALRGADLTEKTAFFEAYGIMAGAAGVQRLGAMLQGGGGFLKRKEDPETRACAAMALGKIGTPEARALLEQVLKDKEPLVRNAASRALRELGG